jgi:cytochrome c
MKKFAVITAAILSTAGVAHADDVQALLKAKSCNSCHDVKMDQIGPSFTSISHRFSGLRNSEDMLIRMVENGTGSSPNAFHWGSTKMPPSSSRVPVSHDEAKQLVDYILSLK